MDIDTLVTPCISFKTSCNNIDDLDIKNYKVGDLVFDTSKGIHYLKTTDTATQWEPIGSYSYFENGRMYDKNYEIELKETKCRSCGAPIKIKSRYDDTVRCEYCGSTYNINLR